MKQAITVSITGAAGQIGYALLFRIASGSVFGPDQPVKLRLIEIEPAMEALRGTVMELDDCAFPLLQEIVPTCDLDEGFRGANWALLVGSVPRKAGMERSDLLGINGKIFTGQGQAIARSAAADVRVLVVGNPCNTNCLIAMNNAEGVPNDRFFAMTRLDENRAKSQLAQKAGVHSSAVSNLCIWGNHSATQYPDFVHAKISGKPATEVITDQAWLEGDFIATVQQRGAAIIKARGASSAASAANAALDTVMALNTPTAEGDWHSVAICSQGQYGIDKGLIASMPIRTNADGSLTVVEGLEIDDFSQSKIEATMAELREEREAVKDLIPLLILHEDLLEIGGRQFSSRLLLGTGKFGSMPLMSEALASSGCEIVTVALRRADLSGSEDPFANILEFVDPAKYLLLANTSGAMNAEEAVRLARLAATAGLPKWIKLEIHPDPTYLLPDPIETLKAAEILVKEGFTVLPYINADPVLAKRLEEAGAATVMPLGAPIGSNQGLATRELIAIIIAQATVPVIVDAGLGAPSHAAEALEMGADAVLVNTAIAAAGDPIAMAAAFRDGVLAGRRAFLAGLPGRRAQAEATSPLTGFLNEV